MMQPIYYRSPLAPRPSQRRAGPAQQPTSHRPRRRWFAAAAAVVVCLLLLHLFAGHSAADAPAIKSAAGNYCLDTQKDAAAAGTPVNGRPCRSNAAQAFSLGNTYITHGQSDCLSVAGDATRSGSPVVLMPCTKAAGQVWLRDQGGLFNPNSGLCLALSATKPGRQAAIETCRVPSNKFQAWQPTGANAATATNPCKTAEAGERIACYAESEWNTWQAGRPSHEALLTAYTGGTPYEAWCADFVSYVYREAGYPFTQGENNGWNENDANRVQYMGFTKHDPNGYTPQPGDVAYFSYSGGHVEIVVAGGKHPTFIYGNSGVVDPTTGNGQMQANTKTSDGEFGQLEYYLSPKHL